MDESVIGTVGSDPEFVPEELVRFFCCKTLIDFLSEELFRVYSKMVKKEMSNTRVTRISVRWVR